MHIYQFTMHIYRLLVPLHISLPILFIMCYRLSVICSLPSLYMERIFPPPPCLSPSLLYIHKSILICPLSLFAYTRKFLDSPRISFIIYLFSIFCFLFCSSCASFISHLLSFIFRHPPFPLLS